jgi:hypothetical protein
MTACDNSTAPRASGEKIRGSNQTSRLTYTHPCQDLFEREGIVDPDIDLLYAYFYSSHYRATLGGVPFLSEVDKLVKRVRRFRELGESEIVRNRYVDNQLSVSWSPCPGISVQIISARLYIVSASASLPWA